MIYKTAYQKVQDSKGTNKHLEILTKAYEELYAFTEKREQAIRKVIKGVRLANSIKDVINGKEPDFSLLNSLEYQGFAKGGVISSARDYEGEFIVPRSKDLIVGEKYTVAHESNNPVVTLIKVNGITCKVEFSHGEQKNVPTDFLRDIAPGEKEAIINILHNQNKEYIEKIMELKKRL